jgi:hypothetical protein
LPSTDWCWNFSVTVKQACKTQSEAHGYKFSTASEASRENRFLKIRRLESLVQAKRCPERAARDRRLEKLAIEV